MDNQMSSGIKLKLVAIHRPDYYTLFFFPRSMWTRFWAQNVIPHQTSARMTHLKVCMIIISCWDSTLHFNVFITTHMGALVRLWKGGTMFEQLGGTKMTVWQPFISTWMAMSGGSSLEIQKFGCPKGSILGHYFQCWLNIIAATRESIDTDLMNGPSSRVGACSGFSLSYRSNANIWIKLKTAKTKFIITKQEAVSIVLY